MTTRRKKLGLTQFELAGAANCSLAMVQLLEGGYKPKHSPVAQRVEDALVAAELRQKEESNGSQ